MPIERPVIIAMTGDNNSAKGQYLYTPGELVDHQLRDPRVHALLSNTTRNYLFPGKVNVSVVEWSSTKESLWDGAVTGNSTFYVTATAANAVLTTLRHPGIVAGQTYVFEGQISSVASIGNGSLWAVWYNAANAEISEALIGANIDSALVNFRLQRLAAVAPAGATQFAFRMKVEANDELRFGALSCYRDAPNTYTIVTAINRAGAVDRLPLSLWLKGHRDEARTQNTPNPARLTTAGGLGPILVIPRSSVATGEYINPRLVIPYGAQLITTTTQPGVCIMGVEVTP